VHERIGRARRRRLAAAAGAVVAVLVAVAALTVGGGMWTAPPAITAGPTPAATSIGDFPAVYLGGRVLTSTSVTLPDRTASIVYTPDTLDLLVVTKCDARAQGGIFFTVNGEGQGLGLACGEKWSWGVGNAETWAAYGVRVGEPFTLAVEVYAQKGAIGKISIGLATPMDESPTSPPAVLPELNAGKGNVATVRSAPGNPLTPQTIQIGGHQHYDFFVQLRGPGVVRVEFNGKVFMTCRKQDYAANNPQPKTRDFDNGCGDERVNDGIPWPDPATVRVIPEGVTEGWMVRIDDEPSTNS